MDDKKFNIIETVKKKPLPIIGKSVVFSFIVVKVLEFLLNDAFNKDTAAYGIQHVYSLAFLYPIFFIIFLLIVVNHEKRKLNKTSEDAATPSNKYGPVFTWRDIFKSRQSVIFYLLVASQIFGIFFVLSRLVSGLSSNYAIRSMGDSIYIFAIIAVILSVYATVFLENTVVAWLFHSERGNQLIGVFVLVLGIVTAYVTSGISYLWTATDELEDVIQNDYVLNFILPVDIPTMVLGLTTLWLASQAKKYVPEHSQSVKIGAIIAIVSMIVSFTSIPTVLQGLFLSFRLMMAGM